ncbi:MAG TPA: Gfo/Idh/MocA family oxidoreductase [Candidatus Sabulitectum sp.]|nr:Gfo/Idh/MocA family oxidoreductase [Candidatus Sabulitectum sp.]HPF32997.1 Gfo/Idh/MocA family oxidoreductase [Candidatus Sabulitectum sp.]HPJ27687.1 Gfo/Idh/MocA family oxidoreductase [Candidatus Sabulitectum sp.]HPR22807.1 Gfo/Idh/MocA family oxidoreductase [Candidatus Sabulitectum sp.]
MKAGVAGVGHLGFHHARILKTLADQVMIHDTDPERLEKVSKELGLEAAGSLSELVQWSDALDVSCTTSAHYDVAAEAISRRVPVLVEKPLAATVEQGRKLVDLAAGNGTLLAVGHIERFNPAMAAVSDLIRTPIFMEGHRMAGFTPRCTDVSVVMDLMIHDIDLVLWKSPSPVAEIHASGVPVLTDTVDICNARIRFENGAVANLTASRISAEPKRKLRFFQKHGYVSVDFGERSVTALTLENGTILPAPVEVRNYDALTAELKSFLEAVSSGGRPAVTGEEGLRALEAAAAVLEKSEQSISILR